MAPPPLEASDLITTHLRTPRAIIADGPWTAEEILVADDSRILRFDAGGDYFGVLAESPLLVGVSALSWDPESLFGGGLLAATASGIVGIDAGGTVTQHLTFPSGAINSPPLTAASDGVLYTATSEEDLVWSLADGGIQPYVHGLGAVRGMAQSGDGFGGQLLLADAAMATECDLWNGMGRIVAADRNGELSPITGVRAELAGIGALLRDAAGAFNGDLLAADLLHESIIRISPEGDVEEFATGFGNLATAGCLAQASDGALLVLDCGSTNRATAARHEAPPPRVVRIAASGTSAPYEPQRDAPEVVTLAPVSPNPMNPRTAIRFHLTRAAHARLSIHSVQGANVRVLLDSDLPAGDHHFTWDGRDAARRTVASGIYLLQLDVDDVHHRQKIVVLK